VREVTINPDLLAGLGRYFEQRQQERAQGVTETLDAMTERERHLVREAAVMAYVQGFKARQAGRTEIPDGFHILHRVIEDMRSTMMADLYPVTNSLTQDSADEDDDE
jgi:hypothetical protein